MSGLDKTVTQQRIEALTTELRLPTVRRIYRQLSQEVAHQGGDYEAYLAAILGEEASDRAARRIERRIKEARFPQVKLLCDLDYSAESMPPQAQVNELARGQYIRDGANVIALGNSGTGKTHLITGLGHEACRQGLRVRFYPVATLAAELQAAQDEHLLHRYLARFEKWDLVILDELGYLPLGRTGAELLFQAISVRHERRSLAITSNLPFSEWTEVFHTERLTSTILDRVTHHATILAMNGPSFRLRESLGAMTKGEEDDKEVDEQE
jgi:DNA replication protein DnaC